MEGGREVKILLDTNIFLEIFLEQENAEEAIELLNKCSRHDFFISDFSFHSMGILLFRRKQHDIYCQFVNDMIFTAGVNIVSLSSDDTESVVSSAKKFNLDFDDAYQYSVALKRDLTIISFDGDFDRTDRGRKTPKDYIK